MDIRQSYREAAVRGATPVQLVVRLYEQIVEDLRQVAIAVENKNIRQRGEKIKHAILVVAHLQSSLDFAKGGEVAKNLDQFYNSLRQNLVKVQFHPSKMAVQQLITDVMAVRSSWIEVERIEGGKVGSVEVAAETAVAARAPETEHARVDWEG